MSVTVYWVEYVGSETPGVTQHDNKDFDSHAVTSATTINFGNTSARDLTPASYPIAAGANSYAKYFKLQFSGAFTKISNAKIWKSAGDYYGATGDTTVKDEVIWFSGNVNMATPAVTEIIPSITNSTIWTNWKTGKEIPTSAPTINNVVLYDNATEAAGSRLAYLPKAGETESSPGYYSGSRSATIVFQLHTSASMIAGPVAQKTISLSYDRQ